MKILISSSSFLPSVGGLQEITKMLAEDFQTAGHTVTVCTETPAGKTSDSYGYQVVRSPARPALMRLVLDHDVHLQVGGSVGFGWPHFFVRRPLLIYHQYFLSAGNRAIAAVKRHLLRTARENICCSTVLAKAVGVSAWSLGNPYDDSLFYPGASMADRDRDVLFVGRISEGKGITVLLKSLGALAARGLFPTITIAGPEDGKLDYEAFARQHGLDDRQIDFAGSLPATEVAAAMRRHRILVVPSLWEEPFGIVALEGIASGCVVIGTNRGGLPEALGPCGIAVPAGDEEALASALAAALDGDYRSELECDRCQEHLRAHRRQEIAERILERLEQSVRGTRQ